ncbi:MAG: TIGR03943 family protein [Streptosporangiales bacterium]|nr:TIGR03943 family protein [Streptosporangiales bacterium]
MVAALSRTSQNLTVAVVGAALLWISLFSQAFLNYVRPGFRPFLIAAGGCLVVLAVVGAIRHWRDPAAHGDGHAQACGHGGHGPRAAWLIFLPVLTIFFIAPPALGSYTATRDGEREVLGRVDESKYQKRSPYPMPMDVWEFYTLARDGRHDMLSGQPVELTGIVVPREEGGWYLGRFKIFCCAADAAALRVRIHGKPSPPADTWVTVAGTWVPPANGKRVSQGVDPELSVTRLERVPKPLEPYE